MLKITYNYYCDRCGKEIEGVPYEMAVNALIRSKNTPIGDGEVTKMHFHEECIKELLRAATGEAEEEPEEEAPEEVAEVAGEVEGEELEEEEASTPKKRAKIDEGKLIALHNAGWPNSKIADEMRVRPGTIATKIWKLKKEGRIN